VKKYLLDTNVVSEPMKTATDRQVMSMIERHRQEIVTASPVMEFERSGEGGTGFFHLLVVLGARRVKTKNGEVVER